MHTATRTSACRLPLRRSFRRSIRQVWAESSTTNKAHHLQKRANPGSNTPQNIQTYGRNSLKHIVHCTHEYQTSCNKYKDVMAADRVTDCSWARRCSTVVVWAVRVLFQDRTASSCWRHASIHTLRRRHVVASSRRTICKFGKFIKKCEKTTTLLQFYRQLTFLFYPFV
jgi:hypothetical protein